MIQRLLLKWLFKWFKIMPITITCSNRVFASYRHAPPNIFTIFRDRACTLLEQGVQAWQVLKQDSRSRRNQRGNVSSKCIGLSRACTQQNFCKICVCAQCRLGPAVTSETGLNFCWSDMGTEKSFGKTGVPPRALPASFNFMHSSS